MKDIKNILIACDKYKGSLSSIEVCEIIKEAIIELRPQINVITSPMADGGDGTVDTLVNSLEGEYVDVEVTGPLGEKVNSRFGIVFENTAVIEMASASGLWLVPEEKRDPEKTTTYGTGELIKKAMEIGCKQIIIGIGGSATNDAGVGMAQALGVNFFDRNGKKLGYGGGRLSDISKIDISDIITKKSNDCEVIIASDVDNELYGKKGAAYVYGPQKGADKKMVERLDKGLKHFDDMVKKEIGLKIGKVKGSGAAGGLGAGLIVFLNGKMKPGAEIIIELTGMEKKIRNSDLIVTGEGKLDDQTLYGKSPYAIAKLAKKYGKKVITFNGTNDIMTSKETVKRFEQFFDANFSIVNRPMELKEAMSRAPELLKKISTEVFKVLFL